MNKVIGWVRGNLLIVIFGVLALVAIVALPLLAAQRSAKVSEEMNRRLQTLRELQGLERTQVTLQVGGLGDREAVHIDQRAVVNAALLNQLRSVSERQTRDAEGIFEAAEAFNRGDHAILMSDLFPEPRIVPALWGSRFHREMERAYADLLRRLRVGTPPSDDVMVADLDRRRRQFMTSTLQKDDEAALTSDEQARLSETLAQARVAILARAAEDVLFYARPELMPLPALDPRGTYSLEELFRWQWEYWVVSDVLHALADANAQGGNVLRGPVKRVVRLEPQVRFISARPAGGGGDTGFGFGAGGDGGAAGGDAGGPAGVRPDPDAPVPTDFRTRFTGRSANALFDVFDVRLELVVETAAIPQVLDAFARRNFMTVIDLQMRPEDPVAAVRRGYVYGSSPVSRIELVLETVWLRTWTSLLMPEPVRAALGVAPPMPAGVEGSDLDA